MAKERFVSHVVDGKRVSRQSYYSHRGADQIIAHRFANDQGLDPFVRNGHPISEVGEYEDGERWIRYA